MCGVGGCEVGGVKLGDKVGWGCEVGGRGGGSGGCGVGVWSGGCEVGGGVGWGV